MPRAEIVQTWERLVRFHRASTQEMDQRLRDEFDRSLDDYDVLHHVRSSDGPIRMGDLAKELLVANSSCTRIVGRLVDDGLLQRQQRGTDRREVHVELTPAGRRLWRRMATVHTRDIERLVGRQLSGRDLDRARRRSPESCSETTDAIAPAGFACVCVTYS